MPPSTSVRTVDPRSRIEKNRSRPEPEAAGEFWGAVVAMRGRYTGFPRHERDPRSGPLGSAAVVGVLRYQSVAAIHGARAQLTLSRAGSMPIGMFGRGILLLAHDATGSFALAGRVVGAFSLANAFGAVAQGRLMDRY